ncbi:DUF1330 domain-containing protein [uncultured Eudoraea sp.]|uniref:DUF1330 domain-containing protein n=1 Tax=uncultured Eudoraea sp. TaxID=1035614 RepID=UPI0026254D7A|nr:DUF1330 domain-containing protein [uncultured Eudoraea sp.]
MENSTNFYSVPDVTQASADWIPAYLPVANKLMVQHGGKYLAGITSHGQVEGDGLAAGLGVIMQCPSKEAANSFMTAKFD